MAVATAMFSNAARLTSATEPMVRVRRDFASRLVGALGTTTSVTAPACNLDPGEGQARSRCRDRGTAPGYRGAMSRIVVLDYGSGNVRSAERALQRVGADVTVTADAD